VREDVELCNSRKATEMGSDFPETNSDGGEMRVCKELPLE